MSSRAKRLPVEILVLIGCLAFSILPSLAQTVNYSHDDLNRLTWIDYGDVVVRYTYDDAGNRVSELMRRPLATTASPPGGAYPGPLSVALACTDSEGPGCDRIYYTTDGTTPTLSSPTYSSPIPIATPTTLKFFARDVSGVNERVKTQAYALAVTGDLNGDGKTDCADLGIVRGSFGKKAGQAGFDSRADLNKDGVVDVRDLAAVARQLPAGTRCP